MQVFSGLASGLATGFKRGAHVSCMTPAGRTPERMRELIEEFAHPAAHVRDEAVKDAVALGEGAAPHLVNALKHKEPFVRASAAQALGMLRHKPAFDKLVGLLGDEHSIVRSESARALGNLKDLHALPHLQKLLKDKDKNVQANAVMSIGNLDHPSVIPVLVKVIGDKKLRSFAVGKLGGFADRYRREPIDHPDAKKLLFAMMHIRRDQEGFFADSYSVVGKALQLVFEKGVTASPALKTALDELRVQERVTRDQTAVKNAAQKKKRETERRQKEQAEERKRNEHPGYY